jgi:hypothetical protein
MHALRSLGLLLVVAPLAVAGLVACGGTEPLDSLEDTVGSDAAVDGGATDGGARDAGADSAPRDGGAADSGALDAGPVDAGPPNPYAGGTPISAPVDTWSYIPMNDVICGNGSTSGIGFNPSSKPNAPVFVFFMGGGACWNAATCLGGASSNLTDKVGEPEIMADIPRIDLLFSRTAATNPFRDANFVFVPYCTADIHGGDSVKTYSLLTKKMTVNHHGAKNSEAVVKRLLATFPTTPKVYVTGASGGGYGAMMNIHRFRTAWPGVRVDMINDSGTPIQPSGSFWGDMQSAWNLQLPPGCAGCDADVSKMFPYLAATMGNGRVAFTSFTQDKTIRAFTGNLIPQDYENKLFALKGTMAANQKAYIVSGDSHVLLKQDPLPVASSGVTLPTWLTQFANDDPAWAHQGP